MSFLHNIATVARYEARTLRRSWFFRLFSIGAVFIFTMLNIGLFSPIGDESWEMVAIPSALPLVNLYLLNIAQAIVVIFLAADFLKRDKKLDTNEVLYTRSMSNLEYVIGKTWGILRLFLSINIIILGIGLLMNIISKTMDIDILSYLEYILLITVPTIIFSLGLAFMMMSVIRNQAITFLLLLGYAALNMFYLYFRAGSVFDYMAYGFPLFKSGIIGFDSPGIVLNQRLIYFFLGLMLVMGTALIFKRLPQSRLQRMITVISIIVFTTGFGITLFNTLSHFYGNRNLKEKVIETNRQFENELFPSTIEASIDLTHKGVIIDAAASLKILNDNESELSRYLFSLNPSLKVSNVYRSDKELPFRMTGHVVEVMPGQPLAPGDCDSLVFKYSGKINEAFCYPNYSDNIKDYPYQIAMLNVNKRQAFLREDYVLLTPETHWYPVTGLNYYPDNPARIKIDFVKFSLKARSEQNLVAVSQGVMEETDGSYIYTPDTPLTGLTVAFGNYQCDRLKADSVEYLAWHYPGNDYYKKDLAELKDTLPMLVSGIMRDLENSFSTRYPFKTLSLIEVPVQFYSYPRKSTQTRAEVQPSMVILPEKLSTIGRNAGFAKRFAQQKRNMARNNQVITDKELQVRLFNNLLRTTFMDAQNIRLVNGVPVNEPGRYLLGPSFYFFKNNFYSDEYPVINAVFEAHLQQVTLPGRSQAIGGMMQNLSDNDRANLILQGQSLKELLTKNPEGDTIKTVLTVKGDYLFNLIRANTGINEFNDWFKKYIDDNSFKRINIRKFNNDIKNRYGFDFYPFLKNWFEGQGQPGFLFSNLQAYEIVVNERVRYQVTFVVSNPEPSGGLFNVSFRTGGPQVGERLMAVDVVRRGGGGGGGPGGNIQITFQGRGMEASNISKIVYVGPDEAKKVGVVLDAQPRAMLINTLFSKNLPGEINMTVNNISKTRRREPEFEGEEILEKIPPFTEENEIVVDNEDPGFATSKQDDSNPLKKLMGINRTRGENYQQLNMIFIPDYWQSVIQTNYYGKYVRSAVYTRPGAGDKTVTWKGIISQPGYYDVYSYIGKSGDQISIRAGGGPMGRSGGPPGSPGEGGPGMQAGRGNRDNPYRDFHFKVYHDDGVEDVTIEYENAEPGWNKLGTYYLSPDTVMVEMTNKTEGRLVVGDAVKWVIQR